MGEVGYLCHDVCELLDPTAGIQVCTALNQFLEIHSNLSFTTNLSFSCYLKKNTFPNHHKSRIIVTVGSRGDLILPFGHE